MPSRLSSSIALVIALAQQQASANWLLSCSTCVDQTYFADDKLKGDVSPADTAELLRQLKAIQVQQFYHQEEELFNKYFNRTQLGIMAHDLAEVMPDAVAEIPERRHTDMMGASKVTKNVMMIRDSHLMFTAIGALNHLAHDFDMQGEVVAQHGKSLGFVKEEQELNKKNARTSWSSC